MQRLIQTDELRVEIEEDDDFLIGELLRTPAWKVVRRRLERRAELLRSKIAGDFRLDEAGLRQLQTEHALLLELAGNPVRFLLGRE